MPDVLTGESLALSTLLNDPTEQIVAHLAKSTIGEGQTITALNQLTECDFPGYAPVQIVNPDCFQTEDEFIGEAVTDPIIFTASDDLVTPQLATAVYVTWKRGADAPLLWRVYPLVGGYVFDLPGRKLPCQLRINSLSEQTVPDDPGVPGQL